MVKQFHRTEKIPLTAEIVETYETDIGGQTVKVKVYGESKVDEEFLKRQSSWYVWEKYL